MKQPRNQDPAAWARYNQIVAKHSQATQVRMLDKNAATGIPVHKMPSCVLHLLVSVRGAITDLECGGERENRIAQQLLEALAVFAQETGT